MKLPFWVVSMGKDYVGKQRDIEKIKYLYEGITRDEKINAINYSPETYEYKREDILIKRKYSFVNEFTCSAMLDDLDYNYGKISKSEYDSRKINRDYNQGKITKEERDYACCDLISNPKEKREMLNCLDRDYDKKDEYDYRLEKLKINFNDKETKDYKLSLLELDKEFEKIDELTYQLGLNDLSNTKGSYEWEMKKITIEKEFGTISLEEFTKKKYTLDNEPYFSVISEKYHEGKIEFILDWNEVFIQKLKEEGMVGYTDQQMVDEYFKDICKQIAEEEEIFEMPDSTGPMIYRDDSGPISAYS